MCAVTLQVWPEMIHAWHLFHPQLAAGREALEEVGRFVPRRYDERGGVGADGLSG